MCRTMCQAVHAQIMLQSSRLPNYLNTKKWRIAWVFCCCVWYGRVWGTANHETVWYDLRGMACTHRWIHAEESRPCLGSPTRECHTYVLDLRACIFRSLRWSVWSLTSPACDRKKSRSCHACFLRIVCMLFLRWPETTRFDLNRCELPAQLRRADEPPGRDERTVGCSLLWKQHICCLCLWGILLWSFYCEFLFFTNTPSGVGSRRGWGPGGFLFHVYLCYDSFTSMLLLVDDSLFL